ncbi:kinase RLK-Pelle-WAK family protein, partial [Tanacetum coccineum]
AGCSTNCPDDTVSERNRCVGIGCCRTMIPYNLKSYSVNLTRLERLNGSDESCGSAFLVDERSFSSQSIALTDDFGPISLVWTLTERDYYNKSSPDDLYNAICELQIVDLSNNTWLTSRKCACSNVTQEGNPYLPNGCEEREDCIRCEQTGGSCVYQAVNYEFGVRPLSIMTCEHYPDAFGRNKTSLGVILGVSISMGLLFLTAFSYALFKIIKKTRAKRRKEWFFKRNGGLLLKQQEAADTSLADKTILFTSKELEIATDHFNEKRILGRGGQGTVYKGMLTDGRIVAIKKSKVVDESQIEQFINEVVVLSQVNHRNVVQLLGCCLETDVPMLVSEFISNGTLYELIQDEFPIPLNMRLQIATEVAGALSYLHSRNFGFNIS